MGALVVQVDLVAQVDIMVKAALVVQAVIMVQVDLVGMVVHMDLVDQVVLDRMVPTFPLKDGAMHISNMDRDTLMTPISRQQMLMQQLGLRIMPNSRISRHQTPTLLPLHQ